MQEVMQKREGAIKSVCTGMEELGLVTLAREFPEIMKQVFVHSPHRFDADCFKALVSIDKADLEEEDQTTLTWFWRYVDARDTPGNYTVISVS